MTNAASISFVESNHQSCDAVASPHHVYPNWLTEARNAFVEEFDVSSISNDLGEVLDAPILAAIGLGRRVRPSLFFAFWKSVVGNFPSGNETSVSIAVELFHAASIIVDDLADKEDARRDKMPLFLQFGNDVAVLSSHALVAKGYQFLSKSPDSLAILLLWTECYLQACIGQSKDYGLDKASSLRVQQEASLKKTEAFFGFVGASLDLLVHRVHFQNAFKSLARIFQIGNDVFDLLHMDTTPRMGDSDEYPLRLSFLMPVLVENNIVAIDEVFTLVPLERLKEISINARDFLPNAEELLGFEKQKAANSIRDLELNATQKVMCLDFIEQCCTFSFWNHDHDK